MVAIATPCYHLGNGFETLHPRFLLILNVTRELKRYGKEENVEGEYSWRPPLGATALRGDPGAFWSLSISQVPSGAVAVSWDPRSA